MRWLRASGFLVIFCLTPHPGHATAPGDFDTTFALGGVITESFGSSADEGNAIAVLADGRLLIAGRGVSNDLTVARFESDGVLDPTFGIGGLAAASPFRAGHAMLVHSDGRILVGGESGTTLVLVRFTADGTLDSTFAAGGIALAPAPMCPALESGSARAVGVVEQSDGRIVVAATCWLTVGGLERDVFLHRYHVDGTLDSGFGTTGTTKTALGAEGGATALALQPDDKLVVAAWVDNGGPDDIVLARYDADGHLDGAFGTGGIVTTSIAPSAQDRANDVVVQADGRIVVAGRSGSSAALLRYESDGVLDATFGVGGVVLGSVASGDIGSLVLQSDGKIIAASGNQLEIARVAPDGSLDACFGTGGSIVSPGLGPARDLALDLDGDLLVVGNRGNLGIDTDVQLVRYVAAGGCGLPGPCGDGVIDAAETCDDGNVTGSDGCSGACIPEAGWTCSGQPSECGLATGVAAARLTIIRKFRSLGGRRSAKVAFVARDPAITKGPGTALDAIEAKLLIEFDGQRGGFWVPRGISDGVRGWRINDGKQAKYLNKESPFGPSRARVVSIREGSRFKLVGKSLGDVPVTTNPVGDITATIAVENDGGRFIRCARFPAASVAVKEAASGTGTRTTIKARDGIPVPCS